MDYGNTLLQGCLPFVSPLSGVLVQILNYTRKVEIVAVDRIFLGKVLDRGLKLHHYHQGANFRGFHS
jgi:hypothetical protein